VDFGRVNGNLALSRAIGDFEFKKSAELPPEQQIVTAYPDVTVHETSDDDEFLVIACDGKEDQSCGRVSNNTPQVSGIASLPKPSSNSCAVESPPNKNCKPSVRT
jgi:hypothetical protein